MVKIYTRTGDKGETSLFGGKRVSKASLRVETYGTVDELNSVIGVVLAESQNSKLITQKFSSKVKSELEQIQNDLLAIGSTLATPDTKYKILNTKYLEERINGFERLIDDLTEKLPELKNFILPGGGEGGAHLHLARTVCRRVERRLVELSSKEDVDDHILKYFNRLSDLLFTMARYCNHIEKKKETIWVKK